SVSRERAVHPGEAAPVAQRGAAAQVRGRPSAPPGAGSIVLVPATATKRGHLRGRDGSGAAVGVGVGRGAWLRGGGRGRSVRRAPRRRPRRGRWRERPHGTESRVGWLLGRRRGCRRCHGRGRGRRTRPVERRPWRGAPGRERRDERERRERLPKLGWGKLRGHGWAAPTAPSSETS